MAGKSIFQSLVDLLPAGEQKDGLVKRMGARKKATAAKRKEKKMFNMVRAAAKSALASSRSRRPFRSYAAPSRRKRTRRTYSY